MLLRFVCKFGAFLDFLGVILNREIDPFRVIFRLGTTRHSISHTRKWLKQMRNQNVQEPLFGSVCRHNLTYLNQSNCAFPLWGRELRTIISRMPQLDLSNEITLHYITLAFIMCFSQEAQILCLNV